MPAPPADTKAAPSQTVGRHGVPLSVILTIAVVAQFMVILDTSIVNVALPKVRTALHLSVGGQQWVVAAYLITFGGLVLLASRAGDLFGRRETFQVGLTLFTVASLCAGLSGSGWALIASRAVQGVGAAALAPSSLSLIMASHHEERQRTRALTLWSTAAASAATIGMVLGGLLTDSLSWRWIFFINVPIGTALLLATIAYLRRSDPAQTRSHLDVPGALTATFGVGALVYGISEATNHGWASSTVVGALIVAVVLLTGFVVIETHTAQPMVPFAIFAHRNLRVANLIMLCLGMFLTATIFFLSLYFQQLLGYSAVRAGLALAPMTAAMMAGGLASQRILPILGPRPVLVGGALLSAAGLGWLSRLPAYPAYVSHILGPSLLIGIGVSVMVLPMTMAATSDVDHRDAGLASGLLNMGRQIGGSLGLAILVTIAATVTRNDHSRTPHVSLAHGYQIGLLVAAVIGAVTALAGLLIRPSAYATADPGLAGAASRAIAVED